MCAGDKWRTLIYRAVKPLLCGKEKKNRATKLTEIWQFSVCWTASSCVPFQQLPQGSVHQLTFIIFSSEHQELVDEKDAFHLLTKQNSSVRHGFGVCKILCSVKKTLFIREGHKANSLRALCFWMIKLQRDKTCKCLFWRDSLQLCSKPWEREFGVDLLTDT